MSYFFLESYNNNQTTKNYKSLQPNRNLNQLKLTLLNQQFVYKFYQEMSNLKYRSHSNNNKENCFRSLDRIQFDQKQHFQYQAGTQYTPWNIPVLKHSKTPLAKSCHSYTIADAFQLKNDFFVKRKSANKSEQLGKNTIASELKRQAEYLDSDIEQYSNTFLHLPTQGSGKINKEDVSKSVRWNNFLFNIIQQKKIKPKMQYPKYTRFCNQSLQTPEHKSISSKQTLMFNNINRKGTQQTSRPRKKLNQSNKSGSTQYICLQKQKSIVKEDSMFDTFNRLIRGRKLKMLRTKRNTFI